MDKYACYKSKKGLGRIYVCVIDNELCDYFAKELVATYESKPYHVCLKSLKKNKINSSLESTLVKTSDF